MCDMTIIHNGKEWSVKPHSRAADAFVSAWFAKYADADLNETDLGFLVQEASKAGFTKIKHTREG